MKRDRMVELAARLRSKTARLSRVEKEDLAAFLDDHSFQCPAFIYGGPGHQSRHTCELTYPHPLDDEHSERSGRYEWTGSAELVDGKLVHNPQNEGWA